MEMTGDPNQRNKPTMFGFESSYAVSTSNLSPFSQTAPTTITGDPAQCLFASNTSSAFPVNNAFHSTVNVPFTSGYLFPSTSLLNMPSTSDRFSFPFSQPALPTEGCSSFPESSGSFPDSSTYRNQPYPYHFVGNQLNWTQNATSSANLRTTLSLSTFTNDSLPPRSLGNVFGCKRKTESPPLPPLKQHITEERMAEHMSRLHISSQTPTSSKESQPVRERRLYMCEEMQRLQAESIIPAQILEKVNRPCTALVPWRPPIVPPLPKENNNNEEEQDNNVTERSDGSNNMDMDS